MSEKKIDKITCVLILKEDFADLLLAENYMHCSKNWGFWNYIFIAELFAPPIYKYCALANAIL